MRIEDVDTPRVVDRRRRPDPARPRSLRFRLGRRSRLPERSLRLLPRLRSTADAPGRLLRLPVQPPQPARTGRRERPAGADLPRQLPRRQKFPAAGHSTRLSTEHAGVGSNSRPGLRPLRYSTSKPRSATSCCAAPTASTPITSPWSSTTNCRASTRSCAAPTCWKTPACTSTCSAAWVTGRRSTLHLPLVNNADGIKLSKQTGAQPLDHANAPRLAARGVAPSRPAAERRNSTRKTRERSCNGPSPTGTRRLISTPGTRRPVERRRAAALEGLTKGNYSGTRRSGLESG